MAKRSWFEFLIVSFVFVFAFSFVAYVHFLEKELRRDKLVQIELESARRGVIAFYLLNKRSPVSLDELYESKFTNYATGIKHPYLIDMEILDGKIISRSNEKYVFELMNSWVYNADAKYLSW